MDSEYEEYLQSTKLCNWDSPEIIALVEELCGDKSTNREKALAIHRFVRDEIRFGINDSKTSATKVLKLRTGECVTKTNFQIALLRAAHIPARFHASYCKSEALRGVVPDWLAKGMPETASHFWCECYLDDKWIACSGFLDRPLYEKMLEKGWITPTQIPTIDWDGNSDLIVLKPWIVEDRGTVASYEEVYEILDKRRKEEGMPSRFVERLFGWLIYRYLRGYTNKVRTQ